MSKIPPIQVFEYESIAFKGRHHKEGFSEEVFNAFEKYFQANERTPFFEMIPYGVRFKQYVGAIQIGKHTIEVLPKAGKEGNEKVWQSVLLDMLKACHLLTAKETGVASLKLRANSILDLYFELYVQELESLLHQGLIKKYRQKSGQQKALKGALIFSKQISQNIVHKERFYTRHTVYDKNHLLHQILAEALTVVARLSSSARLKDRIGRVQLDFPEVSKLDVSASYFAKLRTDRKTAPYQKAIGIAKLIILNYRPDISAGKNDLLALMFDMNVLWEEYVYRILNKQVRNDYEVLSQKRYKFWEHKIVQPDLILKERTTNQTYVIDTKWKVIDSKHPADDDLKQMYVYNYHSKSLNSMLLYPRTHGQEDVQGKFRLLQNGKEHYCSLGFVDVIDGDGLNKKMASDIIRKLEVV